MEFYARVRDIAAVQRGLAVTGGSLDGNQFVQVAALHQIRGFNGPHGTEALRKDILGHGQVTVHGSGIHTGCKADAGVIPTGRRENLEQRIGNKRAVSQVAKDFRHTGVGGIQIHLVALVSGPELQGSGSLQEFTHTLRILHTRQFDEDLAGIAHLLDVGLGDAETVDTVTEHVEGVVHGALCLAADHVHNFPVGGFGLDLVAEFVGAEHLCHAAGGGHLVPGFLEQADEVLAGVYVIGLCLGQGGNEIRVRAVAGESLHQVFQLHLQHYVHTTLEVQTQVDFLLLDALVSVSEEHFLRADGVYIGPVSDVGHGVGYEFADLRGDVVSFYKLLRLLLCILGSLPLLNTGNHREGELPDACNGKQDSNKSDPTFALHFFIVLNYILSKFLVASKDTTAK